MFLAPSSAYAQACAVTSGGGTVGVPANGSAVTCYEDQTSTTQIGNGTTNATVTLENGHFLDRSAGGYGVHLNNATITLGTGARIDGAHAGFGTGVYTGGTVDLTLGENAQVNGAYGVFSSGGNSVVTLGKGAEINSFVRQGIYTNGRPVITLGENAQINAAGQGVMNGVGAADRKIVLTLGKNAQINAGSHGVQAKYGDITLNSGAQINGGQHGISLSFIGNSLITLDKGAAITGANVGILGNSSGADTVDSSGRIEGGSGTAINLRSGNDTLILRTGSEIVGAVDGGVGTDTLTLFGVGTEDDNFLNFESLTMNGDLWTLSGVSSFGTATLNSGVLLNNGTATSNVNIGSGATYGGAGTTTGNINNSGILAPVWESVGTHTLNGNFVQNAGGGLIIEFGPASTDMLDVTGTATVDGRVSFTELTGGTPDGTVYTFIQTTGGIAGAFSEVNSPLFFNTNVVIGANDATVTLNRIKTATAAQTSSEAAVANALDSVLSSNPASVAEIDAIMNGLSNNQAASDFLATQSGHVVLTSVDSVSSSLQQVGNVVAGRFMGPGGTGSSGNAPAASISYNSDVSSIAPAAGGNASQDQKDQSFMGQNLTPQYGQEKAAWFEVSGGLGKLDGDSHARGGRYKNFAMTAGLEFDHIPGTVIGGFGSFSRAHGKVDGLNDKSTTSVYQAGLYASRKLDDHWRVSGSASGAFLDFKTSRLTQTGTATGNFHGGGAFLQSTVAYDMPMAGGGWLSPFMGMEGSLVYHEDYEERGAGALNLKVSDETTTQLASKLGMEVRKTFEPRLDAFEGFKVTTFGSAAWAHEFSDNSTTTQARFTSAPATLFKSQGPERDRDSLQIKLDVSFSGLKTDKMSGYVRYDGEVAPDAYDHALTCGIRLRW
ncbi:MAG: autotransporter domain-containing protein [Alphaproteobacteria bacterium]|nr:autotransporter domain-containing protein [Alphaproteobacteria bacterium]